MVEVLAAIGWTLSLVLSAWWIVLFHRVRTLERELRNALTDADTRMAMSREAAETLHREHREQIDALYAEQMQTVLRMKREGFEGGTTPPEEAMPVRLGHDIEEFLSQLPPDIRQENRVWCEERIRGGSTEHDVHRELTYSEDADDMAYEQLNG